jgi:hypothetical protein
MLKKERKKERKKNQRLKTRKNPALLPPKSRRKITFGCNKRPLPNENGVMVCFVVRAFLFFVYVNHHPSTIAED